MRVFLRPDFHSKEQLLMVRHAQDPVVFSKFGGIRNNTPAENFALSDLQAAVNCDVDNDEGIMTRGGQTLRLSGAYHSLWSRDDVCLIADGASLKRVRVTGPGTYALDTVRSDLTIGARLSYWMVNLS